MDNNLRKKQIFEKYLENKCSRAELEELFDYLESDNGGVYEDVTKGLWDKISAERVLEAKTADKLVEQAIRTSKRGTSLKLRIYRLTAAAALAALIATGGFLLFSTKEQASAVVNQTISVKNDIRPGRTKAIIQANGTQVTLNKKDTSFALGGNIVHVSEGNVEVSDIQPVKYTLIVPRGGTFSLMLADGTKVWLNADSKLVYPSSFSGNYREVNLEGEAYFEVKKDPKHPFIVHTKRQNIKVLGTEFNVHAYSDEATCITTLIKGKVQVNSFDKKISLSPGQQITSNKNGKVSLRQHADTKEIIAWKNGYFLFNNTRLREVMRRLSRWYDIDVTYEEGVKPYGFMAIMSRENDISEILDMLEATEAVHFKVKGKEVTVLP